MSTSSIVVYRARRILTMNPARPEATHVAVREGRILGVGPLEELAGWGAHTLDETFADKVLMPGLVEGHSHASEGSFWRYTYVGNFDRMDPDGKVWAGVKSVDAVGVPVFSARIAKSWLSQSSATSQTSPRSLTNLPPPPSNSQRIKSLESCSGRPELPVPAV